MITHTLTQRHFWPTGDLKSEYHVQQPGPAPDARAVRIRRLKDQGRTFTTDGGVVTFFDHYDDGDSEFDMRVELEWTDGAQPDLFDSHTARETP